MDSASSRTTAEAAHPDVVPHGMAAGWGMGTLATATMLNAPTAALLFFLVTLVKLDPFIVGALIFAGKIVDVLTDPPVGMLSDRTVSRYGRRRPWLLGSSFACGIAFALLFNAPPMSDTATYAYVAAALALFAVSYTGFQVPYMAMPAEMTDDYHQRTRIMSWRVFFMSVGQIAGFGFPALVDRLGGERSDYGTAAVYYAVGICLVMLATFFFTAGTRQTRPRDDEEAVSLRQHLDWLRINRPLMILIGTKITIYLGLFASLTTALFFFKGVLKLDGEAFFMVFVVQTLVSIAMLPACAWLSRRIGKKSAYIISLAGFATVAASWILAGPGEPLAALLTRAVLLGLFGAGAHLYGQSMLVDTFALDYRQTGRRREGVLAAAFSFVEKACMALAPFIVGVLLSTLGFDKNLDPTADQSPSAVFAIELGFIWIPVGCQVLSVLLLQYYRLSEHDLATAAPSAGRS